MNIAVKALITTALFGILSAVFRDNIMNIIGFPIELVSSFIRDSATMISEFCSLGDVFLTEGSTLEMVKGITIFIFFYVQYRIFYPIFKLLLY